MKPRQDVSLKVKDTGTKSSFEELPAPSRQTNSPMLPSIASIPGDLTDLSKNSELDKHHRDSGRILQENINSVNGRVGTLSETDKDSIEIKASVPDGSLPKHTSDSSEIKKSKSLTKRIKELNSSKEFTAVRINLFPGEEKLVANNNLAPLEKVHVAKVTESKSDHSNDSLLSSANGEKAKFSTRILESVTQSSSQTSGAPVTMSSNPIRHGALSSPSVTRASMAPLASMSEKILNSPGKEPEHPKLESSIAVMSMSLPKAMKLSSISVPTPGKLSKINYSPPVDAQALPDNHLEPIEANPVGSVAPGKRPADYSLENDIIIQEKLQEAKALNRKNEDGATMHKFCLWKKASIAGATELGQIEKEQQKVAASNQLKPAGHATKLRALKNATRESDDVVEMCIEKPAGTDAPLATTSGGSSSRRPSLDGSGPLPAVAAGSAVEKLSGGDSSSRRPSIDAGAGFADDDSAYSSDFETLAGSTRPLHRRPLSAGKGLASSLRSKVVDAKQCDASSVASFTSETIVTQQSVAVDPNNFRYSASMPINLSGKSAMSRDFDDGSIEEEEEVRIIATMRSNSMHVPGNKQLQTLVQDNGMTRLRSTSTGGERNRMTNSILLSSTGIAADIVGQSKYQTLKKLKSNSSMKRLKSEDADITSVLVANKEREADNASPTLSELSDEEYSVVHELVKPIAGAREVAPTNAPVAVPPVAAVAPEAITLTTTDEFPNAQDENSPLRWKKGETIGEGTFGKVYRGMNEKTGELLAIKQIYLADGSDAEVESLRREISVMWNLDHENIVRYRGTSRTDKHLFIILEFVTGGSIASMLTQFGPFSDSLLRKFTHQILCGVQYLHSKGIVHRDIKGANILVTDTGIAKLADFGCSKQLVGMCTGSLEESLRVLKGSVPWMAPEVIKQSGFGRSSDIWSVGATVIEMGKPPWPQFTNNLAALFHIATCKEPPPLPSNLSPAAVQLLTRCLQLEAELRPTADELLAFDFVKQPAPIAQSKPSPAVHMALQTAKVTANHPQDSENSRGDQL